eukprot:GFUD01112204.1.p1 GENE.GFUD01112204.1~~GFUD01112204.1.p1  ORF type:complete len:192 (-),score=33.14 GFUD01112204.1:8-583(-)
MAQWLPYFLLSLYERSDTLSKNREKRAQPSEYKSYSNVFQTPLHLAVGQNNAVLVGELLHYSASPFSPTSTGDTCYHLAVRQGAGQCLGMLLRRVPDRTEVNLFNDQGQTALHLAVSSGQDALVKMLLAYGAKPDIQDAKSGKTGLFLAIERGNQSMAEQLLCYGGSVSIPSYGGVAPASLEIVSIVVSQE